MDIPSKHPNQIGACSRTLHLVVMTTAETAHFFKNLTENQNAGFQNELGKGRAREKTAFL